MRYKIYYFCLIASILGFFFGMYYILEEKEVNMSEIKSTIEKSIDLSNIDEDDGSKLRKYYSINKYEVDDFVYYPPKTNMDASEILIIKTKDEKDLENIIEKVNSRINDQSNSFKNYDMEQYEILSNHVLIEKGSYCILIIHEDSKNTEKDIRELYKR